MTRGSTYSVAVPEKTFVLMSNEQLVLISNEQLLNGEEAYPSDGIQLNGWDSQAEQNLKAMSKSRRSKMEAAGKTNWTSQGVADLHCICRTQGAKAQMLRQRARG